MRTAMPFLLVFPPGMQLGVSFGISAEASWFRSVLGETRAVLKTAPNKSLRSKRDAGLTPRQELVAPG